MDELREVRNEEMELANDIMDEPREVRNEEMELANDIIDFVHEHPFVVLCGCIGIFIGVLLDDKFKGGNQ